MIDGSQSHSWSICLSHTSRHSWSSEIMKDILHVGLFPLFSLTCIHVLETPVLWLWEIHSCPFFDSFLYPVSTGLFLELLLDLLGWPSLFIFSIYILFSFCSMYGESSLILHSIPSIESFSLTSVFKFLQIFSWVVFFFLHSILALFQWVYITLELKPCQWVPYITSLLPHQCPLCTSGLLDILFTLS